MSLERIYLKDLSFESPGAPLAFTQSWQPKVHMDINTRTEKLGEERHEVVLTITANVKDEADAQMLIVEVQQAGIFSVRGAQPAMLAKVLGVACPNMLFPYVRETIDSVAVRGTFRPLMLPPVDFEVLYEQAMADPGDATRH